MNVNYFLQFLRYCLDDSLKLPESAKDMNWENMLAWAERQSIVGIVYYGIEKAGKSLSLPFEILVQWIGYSQMIKVKNQLVNNRCVEICQKFSNDGLETCILKGQGNAMMYPISLLRTPGDIDLYVLQKFQKSRKDIIRYVKEYNPKGRTLYHHIDYGEYKGVEVEVHYRPSFMLNPIHNYRLQRWFSKMADDGWRMAELPEDAGSIRIPNGEFNIIFQLSHIYNHLLHEGIGLKQVVDYYYLLKTNTNHTHDTNEVGFAETTKIAELLKYMGLEKIAGAMMWVLGYLVHGEGFMVHSSKRDDWMICEPDEKRGKVLLAEIMKGGNFGHYDVENQKANSAVKKNIQRVKRDIRMMRYFPSECLWEPFFRLYHWGWRLAH